jgi:hypothetical protein
MRKRYAFVPTAPAPLERRVALSHGMLAPAMVGPVATASPLTHVIALHGTVKGVAVPSPLASAIPGDLLLIGKGTVSPLGPASLVGTFSIRAGEPTFYDGRVSLFNGRGGLQVHIFGVVGGPSGPPAHLHYEITAGWGLYRGATGKGEVVYDQGSAVGGRTPFSLDFGPSSTPPAGSRRG